MDATHCEKKSGKTTGIDLIDRQEAIDALESKTYRHTYLDQIVDIIKKLPSAQPKIIRCKDCKFWTYIKRTKRYWCRTDDGLYDINPSPNDFCSRAERRTDG